MSYRHPTASPSLNEGVATTVGMHTQARNFFFIFLSLSLVMQFSVGIVQNIRKRTNEKQKIYRSRGKREEGGEEDQEGQIKRR